MFIHFFCAAGIVSLVLLQRGKGADAGAGFGSGASGTVFGARGATTALSRATAILAAIFMVTSLSLAYVGTRKSAAPSSLLDQFAPPAAPATKPLGAPVITPAPAPAPSGAPTTSGAPVQSAPPAGQTPPGAQSPPAAQSPSNTTPAPPK